jgi:hypothetical protein
MRITGKQQDGKPPRVRGGKSATVINGTTLKKKNYLAPQFQPIKAKEEKKKKPGRKPKSSE